MEFGHGVIDRILLSAPMALRPTLRQMEAAKDHLKDEVVSDFVDAYQNILQMNDVGRETCTKKPNSPKF